MASLIVKITGDASGFKGVTDGVGRALDSVSTRAEKVSAAIGSLGNSLSIGLTLPAVAAGAAAVRAAADFEKLNKGLASIMGSTQAGAAEFRKLQDAAKLPGLGLEQAVAGSIRLQVLGNSADKSRKIMAELGNAIALVGGSKDDFAEVTRQLGQMLSVGKVTKENLDTITERIPQISKIMIDTWGPQSVGDPAKFFEKAGISSRQFIDIIVGKLSEGARAGDTFANKMGNLQESVKIAAARIGEKLIPTIERLIPKLESMATTVADAVDGFTKLPDIIQNASIAILGLAVASGPILKLAAAYRVLKAEMIAMGLLSAGGAGVAAAGGVAAVLTKAQLAASATFGTFTAGTAAVKSAIPAMAEFGVVASKSATAITATGAAAAASGGLIAGGLLYGLNNSASAMREQKKAADESADSMKRINDRYSSMGLMSQWLTGKVNETAQAQEKAEPPIRNLGEQHGKAAKHAQEHAKALGDLGIKTFDAAMAAQLKTERQKENNDAVDKAVEISRRYNATTAEQARLNVQVADSLFRYFRVLEQAPDLGGIAAGIKVPKFEAPKIDGTRWWESNPNIGDEGMMTREQAEAVKARYKEAGKAGQAAVRQVSLVVNDLARGITDVIFKGGKLGEMFKSVASQAAQSITRLLIEGALANLSKKLLDVGGIFGKVFGGNGGGASPIFSAASGGGASAIGAAGSSASSISGAASGLTSIVGAVAQVGTMISSIVGNFQFMAMNKSLDLIEKEVRYSQIHLLYTLEKANEYWPYMKSCWESLVRMEQRGAGLTGGVQVNMAGSYLLTDSALDDFIERIARQLKTQGI